MKYFKRYFCATILLGIFLGLYFPKTTLAATPQTTGLTPKSAQAGLYQKFEVTFQIPRTFPAPALILAFSFSRRAGSCFAGKLLVPLSC